MRHSSPDRTLGGMSILSTRSLLVGVYACPSGARADGADKRITFFLPSSSRSSSVDKQTGSDPQSASGETKDGNTFLGELTFDGAEHGRKNKGREGKGFARLHMDVGPVAVERCLPIGGFLLFFVKWRKKCRRRHYNGDYDDDETSFPPIPDEIFVQLQNDKVSATLPIRCRVADSPDPNDDQSMWIGTVVDSRRHIEQSEEFGGGMILKRDRAANATDLNDAVVSDDESAASSVTLTVNLHKTKYRRNHVRCVATSAGDIVPPTVQREPSSKSFSLFSGFYA